MQSMGSQGDALVVLALAWPCRPANCCGGEREERVRRRSLVSSSLSVTPPAISSRQFHHAQSTSICAHGSTHLQNGEHAFADGVARGKYDSPADGRRRGAAARGFVRACTSSGESHIRERRVQQYGDAICLDVADAAPARVHAALAVYRVCGRSSRRDFESPDQRLDVPGTRHRASTRLCARERQGYRSRRREENPKGKSSRGTAVSSRKFDVRRPAAWSVSRTEIHRRTGATCLGCSRWSIPVEAFPSEGNSLLERGIEIDELSVGIRGSVTRRPFPDFPGQYRRPPPSQKRRALA